MSWTRYNLKIPTETYKKLKKIAEQEKTTIADLLRRATKLLLFVRFTTQDPDARLLVERGGEIQGIIVDSI
jgi:hypothetical protein